MTDQKPTTTQQTCFVLHSEDESGVHIHAVALTLEAAERAIADPLSYATDYVEVPILGAPAPSDGAGE